MTRSTGTERAVKQKNTMIGTVVTGNEGPAEGGEDGRGRGRTGKSGTSNSKY